MIRTVAYMVMALAFVACTDDLSANEQPIEGTAAVSGSLPVLHIETENREPVVSKTEYLDASYWIESADGKGGLIGSEDEPLPMQIRGRGHSSWLSPKKPYKIKLGNKTELLLSLIHI